MYQENLTPRVLAIKHGECENLGHFETVLQQQGISVDYLDVATGATFPMPVSDFYSHAIVLGGFMSAYQEEEYPWILYECQLIENALACEMPILGLCLGAQLLAKVLGARVSKGEKGPELGWYDLSLTEAGYADRLFKNFPRQFKALEWHGDTFDLPANCVHLATSDRYPHQAFRYGDRVWALQFHLEVTESILEQWLFNYNQTQTNQNKLPPDLIWNPTRLYLPQFQAIATTVFKQFLYDTTPACS